MGDKIPSKSEHSLPFATNSYILPCTSLSSFVWLEDFVRSNGTTEGL